MANLPLYRLKDGVWPSKYIKFPEDFIVVGYSIVDDNLIEHPDIASYRWSMSVPPRGRSRARRFATVDGKRACIDLHMVVWKIVNGDVPEKLTVDHKNQEPLDNRIENLRLATVAQQGANCPRRTTNTHEYKGIKFQKAYAGRPKPWLARLGTKQTRHQSLGYYPTSHHAAFAYNCGASLFYKEFASLNKIPDGLVPPEDQKNIQEFIQAKFIANKLIPDPKSLQTSSHA